MPVGVAIILSPLACVQENLVVFTEHVTSKKGMQVDDEQSVSPAGHFAANSGGFHLPCTTAATATRCCVPHVARCH